MNKKDSEIIALADKLGLNFIIKRIKKTKINYMIVNRWNVIGYFERIPKELKPIGQFSIDLLKEFIETIEKADDLDSKINIYLDKKTGLVGPLFYKFSDGLIGLAPCFTNEQNKIFESKRK